MAALTIVVSKEVEREEWRSGLTLGGICADDLGHLFTTLEEEEGGHGPDGVLGGDITQIVDIDLDKVDIGKLLAEFDHLGGNDLAGTTPISVRH